GGTSGGPIFITEQTSDGTEYRIALGINTHEFPGEYEQYNEGVRMTSALLQFYKNNSYIN
ncbi:MAG: hypothetical protein IJY74_03680, partial [Oscillospiraceae bacterium]|nr:hypothetical protein [Oscillospiraceae bacterium]